MNEIISQLTDIGMAVLIGLPVGVAGFCIIFRKSPLWALRQLHYFVTGQWSKLDLSE